ANSKAPYDVIANVTHAMHEAGIALPPEIGSGAAVGFGPVTERVLPFGLPCAMKYFQFHTGNVIAIGEGPGDTSDHAEDYRRAEENGGLDADAIGGEGGIQFAGHGCVFVSTPTSN